MSAVILCRSGFPRHQSSYERRSPVSQWRIPPVLSFVPEATEKFCSERGTEGGIGCMCSLEQHRARQAAKLLLSVLLALALSVAVGGARTQPAQGEPARSASGKIQGIVTVLGQQAEPSSLEGIRVELKESSQNSQLLSTLTDSTGHYEFTQLPAGIYIVRVSQQGFKPFAETISLNADKSLALDIALVLDTVVGKVEVK